MNQLYLGINLAAAMFLVSGNCAAFYATGGQVHNKNIRIVINFPPRLIKLLGLSADQKAQLQAILRKAESALLNVEMEKLRAMPGWQNAAMKTSIDEAAVKQRQGEVVASEAKRLQVNVEMFAQMRKVLTDEQVSRIRAELPLENNDFVVEVRLPEGFNDIGISGEQQSRLQAMVHSREPQMVALSRQAQARRIALEPDQELVRDVAATLGGAQKCPDRIAQHRDLPARRHPVEPVAAAAAFVIMRLTPRQRLQRRAGGGQLGRGEKQDRRADTQDELRGPQRHDYFARPTSTAVEQ